MDIAEIRKMKKDIELSIFEILSNFEEKTRTKIEDVRLFHSTEMGRGQVIAEVKLEVKV